MLGEQNYVVAGRLDLELGVLADATAIENMAAWIAAR